MAVKVFRFTVVLVLLSMLSIVFTACKPEEEELPGWRVSPTAIVDAELARGHVEWYFELMEFPPDSFYTDPEAGEITAVTAGGSRVSGFAVFMHERLWMEDVTFFFVTRDERLFYNIGGEEARSGVPRVFEFDTEALTLRVVEV
jgi:hypothetical protein